MTEWAPRRPMLGIGLKIASVACFLTMATLLKSAKGVPVGEMVFFRSFFATIPIFIVLALRNQLTAGLKTNRLLAHILRGVIGVSAMSMVFFALTQLPLPEATTLHYATPLVLVVLSALVLKEQVRLYRWTAVLVGLSGVCIIIWPRLTLFTSGTPLAAGESLGVIAALAGATMAAFAMLATRSLVATEQSATIVLYFSSTASLLALLTAPFGWLIPTPSELALLIGAGIVGGLAQILLTESYRHAEMSIIAPFEYTSMIFSIVVGYFVFAEIPTPHMLVGGTVVVAAGIFIILRERRLGLDRSAVRKVSTPQG